MKSTGKTILIILLFMATFSCKKVKPAHATELNHVPTQEAMALNRAQALETMKVHLDAVSNRNLASLKSTLSPNGQMQLILPQSEITHTVAQFMDYHQEWFAIPNWTFETKILNSEVGETLAMMVVEIVYREPERNGLPYFNRMIVSYDLKKIGGKWYVIKDHASSIEKSTDVKE